MTQSGGVEPRPGAVDPEIARFVEAVQAGYASYPDLETRPLPERRQAAEAVRAPWTAGGPQMRSREDLFAPASNGGEAVRVRMFTPEGAAAIGPALLYLHGGGFTSFSLDTHDRLMREYAARTGWRVLGVDYALSPEAKFPTALHQLADVVAWIGRGGAALGVDPARLAAAGDSAGANLALACAIKLRDEGAGGAIAALLLNYGFFDADFTTASQRKYGGEGALLTRDELAWFLDNYLDGTPHRTNPLALPTFAELHGLPPSFHVIAECDPLSDGDVAMARRMCAAGDTVMAQVYPGAVHSFLEAVSISRLADRALAESAAWLKEILG